MKLQWDKVGERKYETGVDHGVLFPWVRAASMTPALLGAA